MPELKIQKNFPIPFQGLDPEYDGDMASSTIQRAFRYASLYLSSLAQGNVQLKPGAVQGYQLANGSVTKEKLALTSGFAMPLPEESRVLHLAETSFEVIRVGFSSDPRVRYVTAASGSGLSSGVKLQRFRIPAGLTLMPLMVEHPFDDGEGGDNEYITEDTPMIFYWGAFLVDIPHSLGRPPTGMYWQGETSGSATGGGGQTILHKTGTAATSGSLDTNAGFTDGGEEKTARLKFAPILGGSKEEITRALSGTYGLGLGVPTVPADLTQVVYTANKPYGPWAPYGGSKAPNDPGESLPAWLPERMISTDKYYSGVIYLSVPVSGTLGIASDPSWRGIEGTDTVEIQNNAGHPTSEFADTALGRSSWINSNLITLMANNLLVLEDGTIDWIMG